ncbi:hypothetical protein ACFXGA_33615 [Actinosynnema sp. NPDC059335]|uniref:hypothetical protein n=1 Tax=Actinosynnema sp. NPDC059335 TaxID=3346804 RepID=UPI003670158D
MATEVSGLPPTGGVRRSDPAYRALVALRDVGPLVAGAAARCAPGRRGPAA